MPDPGSCPGQALIRHPAGSYEELHIDLTPDGTVYGIELLNANQQLHTEDREKIVVINEAAGERREIDLA